MSIKCVKCKKAFVNAPGEICITCKLRERSTTPYTLPKDDKSDSSVIPCEAAAKNRCADGEYMGIVRNAHKEQRKKSIVKRWWKSIFYGIPFPLTDIQYEFTLYSQGNYTLEQMEGYAVVLYGDPGYSFLNENASVKVMGKADRDGVIQAQAVYGIHTNSCMKPKSVIAGNFVRIFSVVLLMVIVGLVIGIQKVLKNSGVQNIRFQDIVFFLMMLTAAFGVIKLRFPKRYFIGVLLVGIGLCVISVKWALIVFGILILLKCIKL